MKAVICSKYGSPDVLEFTEVKKPSPKDDEVLIKICSASVNAADWHLLRAKPFIVRFFSGFLKPNFKILGADIAGVVEAIGKNVTQFKTGDEVFGDLSDSGWGGFAEFVCAKEKSLALKPKNLSFEQASAIPLASITALQALRDKGKIKSGQKVLINGASGGVGTFAVQIAKVFGAEVTAVCSSAKIEMVRKIGANKVIDYTKEDFTKNNIDYDVILAANGYRCIREYKRALSSNGIYVMSGGSVAQMFQALLIGPIITIGSNKKILNVFAAPNQNDLIFMKELIESGKVNPVIDRVYKLNEVADAIRYLEEGHAIGKVVIKVVDEQ